MDAVSEPGRKMRDAVSGSKILADRSATPRADNLSPCTIPAEKGKLHDDLFVYENAMAIVECAGASRGWSKSASWSASATCGN